MAGIVGINHLDGRLVDPQILTHAHQRLAHRGMDDAGQWQEKSIGLAHRLSRTTPEAAYDHQPLRDPERVVVLTADARIDNRHALARALGWQRPLASTPDSRLLLEAYKRWGTACVDYIVGPYAFAIWDTRQQRLVCARDPLGVKPFYYVHQPGRLFTFASEMKALLAQPLVPIRINEVWIACYLDRVLANPEITAYEGVLRLPPGHLLVLRPNGGLHLRAHWTPDAAEAPSVDPDRTDADYIAGFAERFREAVRCRLRAPDPVGAELSGGLDSSSVACVARDALAAQGRGPLRTYSGIFPGYEGATREKIDERAYIRAVVDTGGMASTAVPLHEVSPFAEAPRMLWHADQPPFTFNVYLMWNLMATARTEGVRVLLDGMEGDVVVSHGDHYLTELAYQGRWDAFEQAVDAFANRQELPAGRLAQHYGAGPLSHHLRRGQWGRFIRGIRAVAQHTSVSPLRLAWQYGAKPLLPDAVRRGWHALRGHSEASPSGASLLSDALLARTDADARRDRARFGGAITSEQQAHLAAVAHGAVAQFLEEGDHFAAAHGIERRHPFYDVRLVAYCIGLPPTLKFRAGWTRYILRQSLQDTLPRAVRRRTSKGNLRPNFARNLMQLEADTIDRLLHGPTADRLEPYVNMSCLKMACRSGEAEKVWKALQLAMWLRDLGRAQASSSDRRMPDAPELDRDKPSHTIL